MVGFVLIFTGVLFPSVLASLVNIAGLVLVLSGIISIYILGGANRRDNSYPVSFSVYLALYYAGC